MRLTAFLTGLLTVGIGLWALPQAASTQEKLTTAENEQQYAACMVLVEQNASDALESAVAWENRAVATPPSIARPARSSAWGNMRMPASSWSGSRKPCRR